MKNKLFKPTQELAFTLAEVLVTLGIIGVVAALTIPTMIKDTQNREIVAGVLKFNSNLQQAVMNWKNEVNCYNSMASCLAAEGYADNNPLSFEETIGKYLAITASAPGTSNTEPWLPDDTLNYAGATTTSGRGKVAHNGSQQTVYLTKDGITFSIDFDANGFDITADVNGKKGPNRIGKDVYSFTVGALNNKDVHYYPWRFSGASFNNSMGLCLVTNNCNANNLDPSVGSGASPTAYIILNHKVPDFY